MMTRNNNKSKGKEEDCCEKRGKVDKQTTTAASNRKICSLFCSCVNEIVWGKTCWEACLGNR